jgi:branched-chain amino acid transport system substrate-binding protein
VVERNVFELMPQDIAGQKIEYIVLDDGGDPAQAVRNARKLITDERVDILLGGTTSPNCLAIVPVAAELSVPFVAMGSAAAIVEPMDANRRWVFKTVHNDQMMVEAIVEHMVKTGIRTVGYIGLADATGEGYLRALRPLAERAGLRLVAVESYNRTDTSVTAQVLRLTMARPDAIFIASLGTPAALPQIEIVNRGYTGRLYQNHGVANADFLRVAGAAAEGLYLPIGPLLVASQLPEGNPARRPSLDIIQRYEARFGAGSTNTFISNAYDAWLLFANALPRAAASAKPGTPAFRVALRDAIEATRDFAGTQGVYTMSATDHVGLDARSRQIIRVVKGQWKLAEQDRQ